ncbi:hypothetical protein BYT27DRAFT_7181958 [Phlegmacium glaucopus]|nr:hypothetical protein BYT27DRAFT_7181958 [Phlegmacium glaucopus]
MIVIFGRGSVALSVSPSKIATLGIDAPLDILLLLVGPEFFYLGALIMFSLFKYQTFSDYTMTKESFLSHYSSNQNM